MDKKKLETGAMLNPKCQNCPKKDTCNNKTLCAYLIPKDLKANKAAADTQVPLSQPLKLTPEMLQKRLIEEMLNANIGIDVSSGYMKGGRR